MKSDRLRFRLGSAAALLAGLLLRLWFVVHMGHVSGDSLVYGGIAKTWLQHGVYGYVEPGPTPGSMEIRPTLIRLPGYPIFLAACFRIFGIDHYFAAMYLQVAADLLTCLLAAALAARLFGRRAALPVLWIAALCPFTASYVAAPLTETLVLTTIALAFYAFARWQAAGAGFNPWLWVIAITLAYSLLLRPDQGLLAAAILPAMLWRSLTAGPQPASPPRTGPLLLRPALPVAAAALLVVLPLAPWTVRNWRAFQVLQPLVPRYANDPGEMPPLGFARWYRTWAIEFASTDQVYWNYNGDRIEFASLPTRALAARSPQASEDLRDRTAALLADYNLTTTVTPAIDDRFAVLADQRVRDHPVLYYLALPLARLLNMLLRPRTDMLPIADEWWRWSQHPAQTAFAAAYAALNLAYLVLGLAGFCVWMRRRWLSPISPDRATHCCRELAFAMAAATLLRAALLLTVDNSEPRYTLEFFPTLFVLAGALFARPPIPDRL